MVTAPNEKRMASDKNQEIYHRLHDRTTAIYRFCDLFKPAELRCVNIGCQTIVQ